MIKAYMPMVAPMIEEIIDKKIAAERETTIQQVIAGVRNQLAKHPLVESYQGGDYGEGGAGVTIIKLAPKL